MFCKYCGASVADDTTFCPACGQNLKAEQAAPPPIQQNAYQGEPTVRMGAYLTWAIITTALCCWPFGIAAIVNATKINKFNDAGDYAGAEDAARKAKKWTIVAACVGLVLNVLLFIIREQM